MKALAGIQKITHNNSQQCYHGFCNRRGAAVMLVDWFLDTACSAAMDSWLSKQAACVPLASSEYCGSFVRAMLPQVASMRGWPVRESYVTPVRKTCPSQDWSTVRLILSYCVYRYDMRVRCQIFQLEKQENILHPCKGGRFLPASAACFYVRSHQAVSSLRQCNSHHIS
jgi:hypothetical protein